MMALLEEGGPEGDEKDAEVEAIRQACQRRETLDLRGCSLYSTVEPCVLCGYAIRRTGIAHVVYGVPAGQAGACTSSYAIFAIVTSKDGRRCPR